jgi:Fe2+ transport system protein FeoA
MQDNQLRPLSMVRAGETVKITTVHAGRGLKSRLASMGLLPNVEITVVRNGHPGPFVISVKDSKMMLGRGIADKVMVL